jgi:uncharacterized protein
MTARLNYVELPSIDTVAGATFFKAVFGWNMTAFGPSYAATVTGDVDLGLDAGADAVRVPLPVIHVDDLDATEAAVRAAGGEIVVAQFDFPGGRRFHFRQPGGCDLAAWTMNAEGDG